MTDLERIRGPRDLDGMTPEELATLAHDIRGFLVREVSRTGGHLGPNLGVVELTMALHRVFDSPRDTLVFDTGHQSYVHKILTGRTDFSGLRTRGGLSGYPSRAESAHDVVENSHASTSLSWAEGIAKGYRLKGEDRHAVAVIGDGALTGGMAWEALNNIASDKDLPLVIVVNDNERSYAPTIGGLADHLAMLRTNRQYEQVLDWGKEKLSKTPVVGRTAYQAFHSMKKGAKDFWAPQGMFEDLGIKYLGPVDGHDMASLEQALRRAKAFGGPVLVHVITQKGRGYEHAVNDVADQFHGIGKINPETGLPLEIAGRSWTDEFSDEMVALGAERDDIVAITAAMMMPVGLQPFADAYPDRIFDVGIAEQHATTMAAGLAFAGMHPVVAIYATFLNRAFDQLLMDCAMHKAGVTFVLDRSGVTGPDGASHHGMWDMSLASIVPGLRLAAPRDGAQIRACLREAVAVDDAPTIVRFPKGTVAEPIAALTTVDGVDVLHGDADVDPDVLLVSVGAMAPTVISAAEKLAADGRTVLAVDPRWVLPVPDALLDMAARAGTVAVVEDGNVAGGVGSEVARAAAERGLTVPVVRMGLPKEFIDHASRGQVLEDARLTPDGVVERLTTTP
ncbi:1-deoxy-D-xylulose-5-phosphate synthase [Janibacter sp. YIM B02568]|uniref:1-deoxy-D-xylulose-5-phosphate synthase n=1 Tax=Janibacter endophyticus TaxID=2806261 RepID=UPI0019503015|nr:1-deoxy-D-xylulose-5-phosphate synthase [Janibacter endophyticus]MBM6546252.1 1-deoxy-D-xylulose-5-phosphate synthase [Janibacter endophyticus]